MSASSALLWAELADRDGWRGGAARRQPVRAVAGDEEVMDGVAKEERIVRYSINSRAAVGVVWEGAGRAVKVKGRTRPA
ncbi:hypothetical protein J1614_008198 [Plenodomus biglobosus]|nr:hypothetical protein J1614_008198 [Plenodomus biglobosus]